MQKIVGLDWQDIQAMQSKTHVSRKVDTTRAGDYGADPIGDGTFRMVPSGDVVDREERNRRLAR
jgi:hypothetical protein